MGQTSSSFSLLDEKVQKWVWRQGWSSLKDIQENSIPIVLSQDNDVIISAATAGGKTEAAFLPILTSILRDSVSFGYQVLYISPLKALINDQYRRLSDMTADMGIDVIPWHGDIDVSRKNRSLKDPNGIVIITPESLESFLINRTKYTTSAFSALKYIVIDELHSFIGKERGKQLQSLLSRIEHIANRHIPRIAMSATFSDYETVKSFLRDDEALPCSIPPQGESNHEIKLLVKTYIPTKEKSVVEDISKELFARLRGSNNLVFANSRHETEEYAVKLSDMSDENGVPNEFRVHHGSLSKIERETVEHELQQGIHPLTAICTSTMELGVDIGKVKSIAQIGSATSISGLRQRLGRSGRRNEPSILRVFSTETGEGILFDLKANLVQNIAVIELLKEHKYETPNINSYHLSTLIQQLLSVIAQFGGFYPKEGWQFLCTKGAFKNVTPTMFLSLLKALGDKDVVSQLDNGQIIIGKEGEKLLKKPDFYVAFQSPKDYSVINKYNSKRLGTIQYLPPKDAQIVLAGRRWIVEGINEHGQTIYVSQVKSGGKAFFGGEGAEIDKIIVEKMRDIYLSNDSYPYLDIRTEANMYLEQARLCFNNNELSNHSYLQYGNRALFFTWGGWKINRTISLMAQLYLDKKCGFSALYIDNITSDDIKRIIDKGKPSEEVLAKLESRATKECQKYDYLLPDDLLDKEYAKAYLDIDSSWDVLKQI